MRLDGGPDGVCLVRIGDDFYAIGDRCSHADYSLAEGEVDTEERSIECWKHGSAFSLVDGQPNRCPPPGRFPCIEVHRDGDDVVVTDGAPGERQRAADRGPARRGGRPGDPGGGRSGGPLGRGPRRDGAQRLGQEHAGPRDHGRPGYRVTAGAVTLDGVDLLALSTWQRAQAGLFLGMQYPIEVPGVRLVES